jgi:hypothetical protein
MDFLGIGLKYSPHSVPSSLSAVVPRDNVRDMQGLPMFRPPAGAAFLMFRHALIECLGASACPVAFKQHHGKTVIPTLTKEYPVSTRFSRSKSMEHLD